ncbi:hypothetical protein P7C70_g319, partial [Phenoliferia sp. Uapishka_3]
MPLLKRRPVPLIPLPDCESLADDVEVFFLKATGEIFLEYEGYANRLSYLLNRIFQCEFSGKTNLDYFSALESEKVESRIVRERFPDELKGRVLHSVQFRKSSPSLRMRARRGECVLVVTRDIGNRVERNFLQTDPPPYTEVMGRLDAIIDLVFERYKDRYFSGEKIFVDLAGDKYFARISKVFPPQAVRTLARASLEANPTTETPSHSPSSAPSTSAAPIQAPAIDDYTSFAHKLGTDLNVSPAEAKRDDDPEEYLYTVQLMDEEHKFEGSFMEVKAKALSRDRLAFSKSILKRYIRECVHRDALIGSPWIVKPAIALQFGIPQAQSAAGVERNKQIREGKLAKRRKAPKDDEATPGGPAVKKRKTAGKGAADDASSRGGGTPAPDRKPVLEHKKPVKYPIEDLELDPMSIHDGRILRRVNAEIPPLPPKPTPSRDLLVPNELFDTFIGTWNFLNVFAVPLSLTNFSLDDLAGALHHKTLDPRCTLLAEIHGSLTNIIGSDPSRVFGATNTQDFSVTLWERERTYGVTLSGKKVGGSADGVEGDAEVESADAEFDALVRKGISHSKRWDRTAKLKNADGRTGWERHTIGALCQRGGPTHIESLPKILRHLFSGADLTAPMARFASAANAPPKAPSVAPSEDVVPESPPPEDDEHDELAEDDGDDDYKPPPKPKPKAEPEPIPEPEEEPEPEPEEDDGTVDSSNPELAYLSLEIGDKLAILEYLCTLVLGSKIVRHYIDDSETQLTEYRKQRADVNKERKALIEQKQVLDARPGKGEPHESTPGPSNGDVSMDDAAHASSQNGNMNGNGNGHAALTTSDAPEPDQDDEEDQLADDDGMDDDAASEGGTSVAASEASGAPTARRTAQEDKNLGRQAIETARNVEQAKVRQEAKVKTAGRKETDKARTDLEEAFHQNSKRDDVVERQFRRFQGVTRCRPLGRDRFFNRYWWFDGIGGMNLIGQGNAILYGTGRLFIQGPTQEDWDFVCRKASSPEEMEERRAREDVDPASTLGLNEWAFYEEEEEVDALLGWLNSKGAREFSLKNALAKWRGYILAGSRRRQAVRLTFEFLAFARRTNVIFSPQDTSAPYKPLDARRSTRRVPDSERVEGYLHYVNKLAKI